MPDIFEMQYSLILVPRKKIVKTKIICDRDMDKQNSAFKAGFCFS